MNMPLFIYFPVNEHLSCFRFFFAIKNNEETNILVHVYVYTCAKGWPRVHIWKWNCVIAYSEYLNSSSYFQVAL